jgi:hypothetical protein
MKLFIKDKLILKCYNRLIKNNANIVTKTSGEIPILSIADNVINFGGISLDDVYEKQMFYINRGRNTGFHFVENILIDAIESEELINQIQTGTSLAFYQADIDWMRSNIDNALQDIENYIGQPIGETKVVNEYFTGDNTDRAILRYKKLRDIKYIEYANNMYLTYGVATISVEDIDIDTARSRGIMQIKPFTLNINRIINRFFPKTRIKVGVEIGFLYDELPNDIINAIELLSCANALSNEALSLSSFSIDGYSESIANPDGRYATLIQTYKSQAYGLLTRYKTGVVK